MKQRVVSLVLIACMAACHRQPGKAPVVPIKPRADVATAVQGSRESTTDMVEAVTQGRSQAPVSLKFELLERPVEGQPLDVAIALLPQIPARLATVEVTASDGLTIGDEAQPFQFSTIEAAQVYRHRIKVTPTAEGLSLLTFAVSLQHDQISDTRVFSIPIVVGNRGVASSGPVGAAAQHKDAAAHRGS